ncbi:MAG: RelA/SpoT family protein [Candidatus Nomurabacteria bacterium]|jgi:GTP pyrophosphokinase|nr:RelA/SpoT family protein [Candidatus Nomurabacteria bacterium]
MKHDKVLERARGKFERRQVDKLAAAIDFASRAHKGQKRLTGEPFIRHPLAVADTLIEWEMDIDSIVAGILHDTVEDTDSTIEDIEAQFGRNVAFLVNGVTKLGQIRKGMREIDTYLPQTKDNLAKLLIATGQDIRVVIIKIADRLHNLETLNSLSKSKQQKIAMESLRVFAPLADRLNMGQVRVRLEEISFQYLNNERFNFLKKQLKKRVGSASHRLDSVKQEVEAELKKQKIKYEMDGRTKSVYSLHKKLDKYEQDFDRIYDLIALRIVVGSEDDCYKVLGILHHLFIPMEGRVKDYISRPKANGYRSLHTTVQSYDENDEELFVEFQIRTHEMHEFAERGLAAGFHYNEQKLTDIYKSGGQISGLPEGMNWVADLHKTAERLQAGEEVDIKKLQMKLFSDRIFVYTPSGDIFDLPEGALPLDFAFRLHTDIGKTTHSVKVNGQIVGFDEPLHTGDVIEVITRSGILPKLDWIKKVITPRARTKIRAQLRKEGVHVPANESQQKPAKKT